MANLLKKNSLGIVAFAASVILVALFGFYVNKSHAAPAAVISEASAPATTTLSYMTPGTATTTFQFDSSTFTPGKPQSMQSQDAVSLYFQYAASSTSSILVVTPQWSNNNVDWYGFNQVTGTPGINGINFLASSTVAYEFTASGTATSSQVINLPNVPSLHERVQFSQLGANGAVYNEVDIKTSTQ